MTADITIRPCPTCPARTASRGTVTEAMKAEGIRERQGGGLCSACYTHSRRKGRPSRVGVALASTLLPSIRDEIATNARPNGWVRDRNGVMRYEGDLDADYAEELAEDGIKPDRPECKNSGRPRVDIDIEEAIRLRREEGLTLAEIGRRLGISASTIAGRLTQAAA